MVIARRGLLILLSRLAAAAVAIVVLVRVVSYYTSTTAYDPKARSRLELIQQVEPHDVRVVYIVAGGSWVRDRPAMSAWLHGDRDREDVARLLAALKNIQVSGRPVRVPAIQERIFVDGGKTKVELNGYFDPGRAPVISPTMRSPDVSHIVQDILRRKGKPLPVTRPASGPQ